MHLGRGFGECLHRQLFSVRQAAFFGPEIWPNTNETHPGLPGEAGGEEDSFPPCEDASTYRPGPSGEGSETPNGRVFFQRVLQAIVQSVKKSSHSFPLSVPSAVLPHFVLPALAGVCFVGQGCDRRRAERTTPLMD